MAEPDKPDFSCTMVPLESHQLFWITFGGRLSVARLAKAYESFTQHPDYRPGVDELLDFTRTTIAGMSRNDFELIRQFVSTPNHDHPGRSVLVVNTDLEFGLTRMMGGMLDGVSTASRAVCYNVPEALEWLRPGVGAELMAAYEATPPHRIARLPD